MPALSRPRDGVASLAHSRPKDGVSSLAHSRPKDGVSSLAYGHPKDGVASLAYVAGTQVLPLMQNRKAWMAGTSPAMTWRGQCAKNKTAG